MLMTMIMIPNDLFSLARTYCEAEGNYPAQAFQGGHELPCLA